MAEMNGRNDEADRIEGSLNRGGDLTRNLGAQDRCTPGQSAATDRFRASLSAPEGSPAGLPVPRAREE